MRKSSKIVLYLFIAIIGILIGTKLLLRNNTFLYVKIATYDDKTKLVEKQWLDLDGRWYVKDTDDTTFYKTDVDDKKWPTERFIYIGQIKGVKAIKWFRKHFELKEKPTSDTLVMKLSLLDIHCKVYINGNNIADSGFIFNRSASFNVPSKYLKVGKNVIAVKAGTNFRNEGNITKIKDEFIVLMKPSINLTGKWKFMNKDIYEAKNKTYNDSSWYNLLVPKLWDKQGFKNYNGIAWYRRSFNVPKDYMNKELVFMAGKIDDFNEVYINGTKIGGNIFKKFVLRNADDWENWNYYRFNGSLLCKDNNLVAVRVYDAYMDGGIYEGPVGIMTLDEFCNFFEK